MASEDTGCGDTRKSEEKELIVEDKIMNNLLIKMIGKCSKAHHRLKSYLKNLRLCIEHVVWFYHYCLGWPHATKKLKE